MNVPDLFTLALQHHQVGKFAQAEQLYRQVLQAEPHHLAARTKLANALFRQSKFEDAAGHFRQALVLNPHDSSVHYNLGLTLYRLGQDAAAADCYRQTLSLQPSLLVAWNNLGIVLRRSGNLDEAIACYRHVIESKPDYAEAHSNLGNALTDKGQLPEAVDSYRQALKWNPNLVEAHSNLVHALHFCDGVDSRAIYQEHRRWNQQHAEPLARAIQPHTNGRRADGRLRIGYVSPDFRWHPVGRFILPLLEAHDHSGFEVICYASQNQEDAITAGCRAHADVWRNVLGTTDEQLAQQIRQDKIDILVDLTMHMENSRLLVFARKPAPIQVTYLAYCSTTGLTAIDYRLTDPYLDPPGQDQDIYSEKSIHLPETYWCYKPAAEAPPVSPLPALQTGQITFGCLNKFCKLTTPTLQTWTRLLQLLPSSRLLLHAHAGSHQDRVRGFFGRQSIESDRLSFVEFLPPAAYFAAHNGMDIALDPFPYGGGTTTCDALWMGVPVITLAGQTAVGRGGLSILSNIGLPDLVATNVEQYLKIAIDLANGLPRLSDLRATLREQMLASPLMDAGRFARNVEAAYRKAVRYQLSAISQAKADLP